MAIAFDTAGGHAIINGGSSFSLTLAGGATCLVASIYRNPGAGNLNAPTWNSVSMTLAGSVDFSNNSPASSGLLNAVYYLLNPATGTHTLATSDTDTRPLGCSASSYTGVVSIGASGHNGNSSAGTLTTTVVTTATGSWLVMGGTGNSTMTAGSGATQRDSQNSANEAIYDSNGTVSVGSNNIALSNGSNNGASAFAIEIAITAGVSTKHNLTLLGVGQ